MISSVDKQEIVKLQALFNQFATFGLTKVQVQKERELDSAKFAKYCKDCKIIDKRCTLTDVDIVFSKFKEGRRMNFDNFLKAFAELANIKFGSQDSFEKLVSHVLKYQPAIRGTVADAGGIFDKLTDTSLYTGTHKLRFDENGQGRGKDGRDAPSATATLSSIVDRSKTAPSTTKKPASREDISPSVFTRLTDSKTYGGTHKHRFDAQGNGLGIDGRYDDPKNVNFVVRDKRV